MWSWAFWRDALERAVTTAAAAALSAVGADGLGLGADVDLARLGTAAALAALASLLLSLVGGTGVIGARGTPSLLPTRGRHARD